MAGVAGQCPTRGLPRDHRAPGSAGGPARIRIRLRNRRCNSWESGRRSPRWMPWTMSCEAPERRRTTRGTVGPIGSAWKLIWGEDYFVSDKAFRAVAYAHAKSHGLTVTTRSIAGGLIIQFTRQRRS